MTKRERKYHQCKSIHRITRGYKITDRQWFGMFNYGVIGSHTFLDDSGNIRQNPLTVAECFDFMDIAGGEIITVTSGETPQIK